MSVCGLSAKRVSALETVDRMSPHLRECVHEFGLPIVSVLTKFGITDPRHIREIVREIWTGPRQTGQRACIMGALDFALARGPVSSLALKRILADSSLAIVSMEPTRVMLDASMAAVTGFNVRVTREEKHRRRLRAALRAAAQEDVPS